MLSEDGFRHHLNSIQHETKMYQVYRDGECLKSIAHSKQVLTDNFLEQQKQIEELNERNTHYEVEILKQTENKFDVKVQGVKVASLLTYDDAIRYENTLKELNPYVKFRNRYAKD